MLPGNQQSLAASIASDPKFGGGQVKVEGKNLKTFIQEVLKEQIESARKQKLTWRRGEVPLEPNDPKKRIGKLRTDQAYIGPIGRGRWYVQNMRIFNSAGQPMKSLAAVSKEPVKEHVADRTGKTLEVTFRSDYEVVVEALTQYAKAAATNDPYLCPYCFAYSNADRKLMTAHVFKLHKKEFDAEMEQADTSASDELPPQVPEVAEPAVG